eukprot:289239_1
MASKEVSVLAIVLGSGVLTAIIGHRNGMNAKHPNKAKQRLLVYISFLIGCIGPMVVLLKNKKSTPRKEETGIGTAGAMSIVGDLMIATVIGTVSIISVYVLIYSIFGIYGAKDGAKDTIYRIAQ